MAKVFTGKVRIPIEEMDAYLTAMQAAAEARQPFRAHLVELNDGFYEFLLQKFTKKTANKHSSIIEKFIEFLVAYTDVDTIESVTKGMANSYFRRWYKKKVWDNTTETDLKIALKKFFCYLRDEKQIVNSVVLNSL